MEKYIDLSDLIDNFGLSEIFDRIETIDIIEELDNRFLDDSELTELQKIIDNYKDNN